MAAVNGITLSGIGDLTTTNTLVAEYIYLLAERQTLGDHPALMYAGSIDGRGSNVLKVSHLGLRGYDLPSATGDGSSVANTALTDGSTTVTVTRNSKAYESTGLARMVSGDKINATEFALDAAMAHASRLTEILADIVDGFAATAGTSGVDLDAATLLGAFGTTRVLNVEGAMLCILHGRQWTDVSVDIGTAIGGALANDAALGRQATMVMGSGWKGNIFGVDIIENNRIVTANGGADRAGACFGKGGVMWGDGTPTLDNPSLQMLLGKTLFEKDRNAKSDETAFVSHCFLGASLGIEAGTSIITDA